MAQSKKPAIRSLRPDDLDDVVRIDRVLAGRSRRGYFEKRLQAAKSDADQFVIIGAELDGQLTGYVFARIYEGEFGSHGHIAVLDTIGVDPGGQTKGVGRQLMKALDQKLLAKGATEIRTQADWTFHGLLGFLAATGFEMAPAHVLECDTSTKL